MSSLPSDDHRRLINQYFRDPLEISLDTFWPSIEDDNHNPTASFNLETFQDYENALSANSGCPIFQENSIRDEPENSLLAKSRGETVVTKTKEINHRFRLLMTEKMATNSNEEEGSTSKKEEHNAKEKLRRMKLNASYLALGSLLPNSATSKKRWTAPVIIDKITEYIPEIESEIEELSLRKNYIVLRFKENAVGDDELQGATVSVLELKQGEVIVQICMQTNIDRGLSFLMQNLEAQGITILSASSISIYDDTISYHLHVQINGIPLAADYIVVFKRKLISFLIGSAIRMLVQMLGNQIPFHLEGI
ncbi:transcription factor bHLH160-like [Mercurialis annua]|uniref:transcription factor bHLH160-like n=1 Tax=Mercurialis annua TaxID=3986 RepID=UPI00215E56FC|nr:transcription factor bHLH160-like [Mercurialis annua]